MKTRLYATPAVKEFITARQVYTSLMCAMRRNENTQIYSNNISSYQALGADRCWSTTPAGANNIVQSHYKPQQHLLTVNMGGGPRVVVSTAAFHARVRGSVP